MDDKYVDFVVDTCLAAGKIMIESGSEMYRVEDTMHRIAQNAGVQSARVFTTPTGLFMGVDKTGSVQIEEVKERVINLEKVSRVNDLSRQFAAKLISLEELRDCLEDVDVNTAEYPLWMQAVGTAILSSTLMVLFMNDYDWYDFIPAAIIGTIGFLTFYFAKKFVNVRFLAEMLAAAVLGLLATAAHTINPAMSSDAIIIGSLMVLVPGLALTNSLRDLLAGHLLSGIGRGVEAILTAIALGGGVGIVIRFLGA